MLVHENEYIRFEFNTPFLQITILKSSNPSDKDWIFAQTTLLDFYTAAERSNSKLAIKVNLQNMGNLSVAQWKQFSNTLRKERERTRKLVFGTCVINNSVVIRMAINGLFMLYDPVRPMHFVSSDEEADMWLEGIIQEESTIQEKQTTPHPQP